MITEHELPAECAELLAELRLVYLPVNSVAESIVRDIAMARWQILRFDGLILGHWNLTLADPALYDGSRAKPFKLPNTPEPA